VCWGPGVDFRVPYFQIVDRRYQNEHPSIASVATRPVGASMVAIVGASKTSMYRYQTYSTETQVKSIGEVLRRQLILTAYLALVGHTRAPAVRKSRGYPCKAATWKHCGTSARTNVYHRSTGRMAKC
jgi:hypothetical protein